MSRKRILIVDDSALMRKMYQAQLKGAGYEIITAVDGIEAINMAFTRFPDLVLLDVHMPRINGYQVCRLLKDRPETKNIPIVIMTTRDSGGMVRDPRTWSFQTGADGYIGQVFNLGIVYVKKGDWNNVRWVKKPADTPALPSVPNWYTPLAPSGTGGRTMTRGPGFSLDRTRAALLCVALALGATAGLMGLFEPTETRYAEIAREMRASGDFLVPHLNGIPHFHKPPLAYWLTAAGFAACGVNEWGARLPVALASLLTLALTALAARRGFASLGVRPGLAAWILGTSALFLAIGRAVASDPFLAATVAGFWALAPSAWAPALLGAGFLVKGPVVLVPTLVIVLAVAALSRDRAPLARLGPARTWWLFAAIGAP